MPHAIFACGVFCEWGCGAESASLLRMFGKTKFMSSAENLKRRDFLRQASAAAAVVGGVSGGAAVPVKTSESLVGQLHGSLSEGQRAQLCRKFDDPLRLKVDNNWMINKPLKEVLDRNQVDLVRQIFLGLHSPEYAERVMGQVVHDSEGEGFDGGTSITLFGEPGSGRFEFVLTGRHCTRRCDGDSVEGMAFGGPIFYGHAAQGSKESAKHPGNVYWYQAVRANEVFAMLDGRQRQMALVERLREENSTATVALSGRKGSRVGVPMGELTGDQRAQVRKVMAAVLAPFRKVDADESMRFIDSQFDSLQMAFSRANDIGNDGVWDIWQIEGPSMVWLFRGAPHVHVWVHVKDPAMGA